MRKNSFFKLYSGDYSQEGYELGVDAAKKQQSKNKFTFFKTVNPINYAWNFNHAFDSFTQNYNKGYLDGQRVNHQPSQPTGNTMSAADNYINHLRMLDEVKIGLTSLRRYLKEIEQKYKQ